MGLFNVGWYFYSFPATGNFPIYTFVNVKCYCIVVRTHLCDVDSLWFTDFFMHQYMVNFSGSSFCPQKENDSVFVDSVYLIELIICMIQITYVLVFKCLIFQCQEWYVELQMLIHVFLYISPSVTAFMYLEAVSLWVYWSWIIVSFITI